jgi:thiamine-phosphate pyrophosphorylase
MHRRQRVPQEWLIVQPGGRAVDAARRLPPGSGILLLQALAAPELRRLKLVARQRGLSIVLEQRRSAARVHDVRELRRAQLARAPLILLSPLFPTRSHPNWKPLAWMRAAALARLGHRRLIALGGMNRKRYAAVAPLGFIGWAGITAFRT